MSLRPLLEADSHAVEHWRCIVEDPQGKVRYEILVQTLRWVARLGSIASLGMLVMFAFGEQGRPSASEWLGIALFPIGVSVGMLLGWWREGLGGIVTLLSLAAFYGWMFVFRNGMPVGPYFLLLSSPGLLFLACATTRRWSSRAAKGATPPQ